MILNFIKGKNGEERIQKRSFEMILGKTASILMQTQMS